MELRSSRDGNVKLVIVVGCAGGAEVSRWEVKVSGRVREGYLD